MSKNLFDEIPFLESKRLILRPFLLNDAPTVQTFAGNYKVAEMTATIPHPYLDGMAEAWIKTHLKSWQEQILLTLAMEEKNSQKLIGCISLGFNQLHQRAELGYWIGEPYWNQGFCTEAGKCLVSFAFKKLNLRKITSSHMTKNPASGKVMQKIGMIQEGMLRQQFFRMGEFHDAVIYGLLKEEFNSYE